MSDAEDTEVVPSTTEVTTATLPSDDLAPPDAVSITEIPNKDEGPLPEVNESPSNSPSKDDDVKIQDSKEDGRGPEADKGQTKESTKTQGKILQTGPPPRSRCRTRSRDTRQCKKHFREMIGKHENRNDELEQRETDLRQRMEMLECSMPAVMVWNIWRMAQGAPVRDLREIVEKQFLGVDGGFSTCPSTPSQHWDCRVREVEAERKQALHRAEEARKVFAVKGDALQSQKQQIDAAKKLQDERKMQIAKLEEEVKQLQDALKKAQGDENFCETGECGEIQCRQMWLQGASSVSSIHSTDLECLARLQDLAEAELCMKRQIADLERRECAYMRTLQQADEMWAKMEDDNASNLGYLKDQLDAKVAANQQLADRIVELEDEIEKLRMQLTKAVATLDEYTSKTFTDVGLGDVNVSTEEKIEQTEDVAKMAEVLEENESKDTESIVISSSVEPILSKEGVVEFEESEQLKEDEAMEYSPIEEGEQTPPKLLEPEEKSRIVDDSAIIIQGSIVGDEEIDVTTKAPTSEASVQFIPIVDDSAIIIQASIVGDEEIDVTTKTPISEEAVQFIPRLEEAEPQSMARKPDQKKETEIQQPTQIEATAFETADTHKGTTDVAKINRKISMKYSTEQQREIVTASGQALEPVARNVDEPIAAADRRLFENKGSYAHLLRTPVVDKVTEVSVTPKPSEHSTKQKESFQPTPESVPEAAPREHAKPAREEAVEAVAKTTFEPFHSLADETADETAPEPVSKPVVEMPPEAPVSVTESLEEPIIELHVVGPTEPVVEATPVPTIDATPEPALDTDTASDIEVVPVLPVEPALEADHRPVLEPTTEGIEAAEMRRIANTLEVPIETLLSWHNTAACVNERISNCARCSPTSGEIQQMLKEIRTCLGEDAPELAKIECAKGAEEIENTTALSNKKGPCICKPKTCPLGDKAATTPPQTSSVQMQTVVDGQSQTSTPVRIPSKEGRSSRSSKSSTKSKEEVKLESIEEGTEADPRMRRMESIPEARDEATVTVDDIASQTETVRKTPSGSKNVGDTCVCPTGVCPKKRAKPPCGVCTPGKLCTSAKKIQGKEYRSTADAILAPAIKRLPGNERGFSPPVRDVKPEVMASESSMSACCICGGPVTPVASKKSTSIPMPRNFFPKNKVPLASEVSDDDFLCCACKSKGPPSARQKNFLPSKSSERSVESGRVSRRVKPASDTVKSSCSREVCCPCSGNQEIHVLTKSLTPELEVSKSKTRPETKDVCCLAKISRDKVTKTESRRRKDEESIKTTSSSVPHSGCGQISSSSSTHKGSRSNVSSYSDVCCSSIEQVVDMMKKKERKGSKCACDSKDGKGTKEKCVCVKHNQAIEPEQAMHSESTVSCDCPPKYFEKS